MFSSWRAIYFLHNALSVAWKRTQFRAVATKNREPIFYLEHSSRLILTDLIDIFHPVIVVHRSVIIHPSVLLADRIALVYRAFFTYI